MRSVSGERAQVKAGEREGGSRVMNLALGGWWRLCHRVQLEHLVQLKHLEHPVHLLHLVHHLTMYCTCTLCFLALLFCKHYHNKRCQKVYKNFFGKKILSHIYRINKQCFLSAICFFVCQK